MAACSSSPTSRPTACSRCCRSSARLLFPFARRVVADATRDGGFPPLMIDPIDFVTLFRRKLQAGGEAAQA